MKRIECLNGVRGLAALWVLLGHCAFLTNWRVPVLSSADLGVDLFILLSGFLMVFQYQQRRELEDWAQPKTWVAFWLRRFFRIAPLYYVLLAVALFFGPEIYADRVLIDLARLQSLQQPERYLDASATNVIAHLTFVFGLVPSYAFRTPLPDWSLGLEMQFYGIFPLLVLLVNRFDWRTTTVLVVATATGVAAIMYTAGVEFPMPAFLPLKMHLFLCGMLIAANPGKGAFPATVTARFLVVMLLASLPIRGALHGGSTDLQHTVARECLVAGFLVLIHGRSAIVKAIVARLSSPFFHWLGELSYGVYLLHLLFMHRAAAWTYTAGLDPEQRFFVTLSLTVVLAYGVSVATYVLIEMPGQRLGQKLTRRIVGSHHAIVNQNAAS